MQRPYEERVLDLQSVGWKLLVRERSAEPSRTVSALNGHVARRLALEAEHDKFAAEAQSEVLDELNQRRRRIIEAQGHCWRFIYRDCPLLKPPGWWSES
jgi:hypothetical protein